MTDVSFWRSVVAVHVALILRSPMGNPYPSFLKRVALFGEDYANASARADPGTRVDPDDFGPSVRTRARRHAEVIIFLHKPQRAP